VHLGILSDTHNHQANTQRALQVLAAEGVTHLIHCGDIASVRMLELFVGWHVQFVFGNTDYERAEINHAAQVLGFPRIGFHLETTLAGVGVAACHGNDPDLLRSLIEGGRFRYVLHGHTHRRRRQMVEGVWVINPGALGGTRRETRSVAVLDLPGGECRFIEWED